MEKASKSKKGNARRKQWTTEEDQALKDYVTEHGIGPSWKSLAHNAVIATYLPGRTDQHIKNHFRTRLSRKPMLPGPREHTITHNQIDESHASAPQMESGSSEKSGLDQLPDFKDTMDFCVMSPPRDQFLDPFAAAAAAAAAAGDFESDEWIECFESQFWRW
ncbi:hypothetical protein J5N97_023442 [Dioscorea zingiberensis]|uniref:Uncharacterized protein n=1 Tax=Dioscorea zingiberensis TaxID=325984 RepID=A0A9D5H7W6_9LILI|nr:hypothetical protein J5N97_023442 [Dioscorea zingiberensis]